MKSIMEDLAAPDAEGASPVPAIPPVGSDQRAHVATPPLDEPTVPYGPDVPVAPYWTAATDDGYASARNFPGADDIRPEVEPFMYAHELLANGGGIWIGCKSLAILRQAHDPGETGEEIVALYTREQCIQLRGRDAITDSGGRSHDAEGTPASNGPDGKERTA
jgi:hypothetical protein